MVKKIQCNVPVLDMPMNVEEKKHEKQKKLSGFYWKCTTSWCVLIMTNLLLKYLFEAIHWDFSLFCFPPIFPLPLSFLCLNRRCLHQITIITIFWLFDCDWQLRKGEMKLRKMSQIQTQYHGMWFNFRLWLRLWFKTIIQCYE